MVLDNVGLEESGAGTASPVAPPGPRQMELSDPDPPAGSRSNPHDQARSEEPEDSDSSGWSPPSSLEREVQRDDMASASRIPNASDPFTGSGSDSDHGEMLEEPGGYRLSGWLQTSPADHDVMASTTTDASAQSRHSIRRHRVDVRAPGLVELVQSVVQKAKRIAVAEVMEMPGIATDQEHKLLQIRTRVTVRYTEQPETAGFETTTTEMVEATVLANPRAVWFGTEDWHILEMELPPISTEEGHRLLDIGVSLDVQTFAPQPMLKFSMVEDENSDANKVGLPGVKIGPVEWYVELPGTAIQIHEAAAKIRRSTMELFQDPENVTSPLVLKFILPKNASSASAQNVAQEGSEYRTFKFNLTLE